MNNKKSEEKYKTKQNFSSQNLNEVFFYDVFDEHFFFSMKKIFVFFFCVIEKMKKTKMRFI